MLTKKIFTWLEKFPSPSLFSLRDIVLSSYAAIVTKLSKIECRYVFHPRGGPKLGDPDFPFHLLPFKYSTLIAGHFLL